MATGALDEDEGDVDQQDDEVGEVDIRENRRAEDSQSSNRLATTDSEDSSVEQSHDVSSDSSFSDRERKGRQGSKKQVIDR